ncbi:MAG: hypothetical protein U5L09_01755 [Bacteroidales bacterium]|nr:hypothetical protein [Bacteroidales bacterium]
MNTIRKNIKGKKSRFSPINENQSDYFKHKPIKTDDDYKRLLRAGTYLLSHFVVKEHYSIRPNKGSLTFQHKNEKHRVVSFTIDYDSQLADKMDIYSRLRNNHHFRERPEDFDEMVIVYIELTKYEPFVRDAIRKELEKRYLYCNPTRKGYSKIHVFPQKEHHYDVLFLPKGPCPEEMFFDEAVFAELSQLKEEASLKEDYRLI